jgi:hypothetical protein
MMRLTVSVKAEEANRLQKVLKRCGYPDVNIPKENSICLIDMDRKIAGCFPAELLYTKERRYVDRNGVTVGNLILMMENRYNISLSSLGDGMSKERRDFEKTLCKYISENFDIDIVELIDTNDKNIAYLKTHAKESDRLFLCKDMDALYQDYVNNLMTVEEFADMVGTRYSYILENVPPEMEMEVSR